MMSEIMKYNTYHESTLKKYCYDIKCQLLIKNLIYRYDI